MQIITFCIAFGFLFSRFVYPSRLVGPCSSLPRECYQSTNEYNQFVRGQTFSGIAYYTNAMTANPGSCGYAPRSVGVNLIALPTPFMFMSYRPTLCNPNCDQLCGTCVLVTNTQTGMSIVVVVDDTANTNQMSPVLSTEAFVALGGSLNAGYIPVTFRTTPCY